MEVKIGKLYVYEINNENKISEYVYEDNTNDILKKKLSINNEIYSLAVENLSKYDECHLIIGCNNISLPPFKLSSLFERIERDHGPSGSLIICKDLFLTITLLGNPHSSIQTYFFNCNILDLHIEQVSGSILNYYFYKCTFYIDSDITFKSEPSYRPEIDSLYFALNIIIDSSTFEDYFSPDALGREIYELSYNANLIFSGDGLSKFTLKNISKNSNIIIQNESLLSLNIFEVLANCGFENKREIIALNILNSKITTLDLSQNINGVDIVKTQIDSLKLNNCNFKTVPVFDGKSSIKHSVDIDKKTFDNLLKIENAGALEFSPYPYP